MLKGMKNVSNLYLAFDKCQQCGKWTSADCLACKERRRLDKGHAPKHARKTSTIENHNQENDHSTSNCGEVVKMSLSSGG